MEEAKRFRKNALSQVDANSKNHEQDRQTDAAYPVSSFCESVQRTLCTLFCLFQLGCPRISGESGTNQKHQTDPDHHKRAPKGFADSFPGLQRMPDTQLTMLTLENPSTQALRKLLPEFEHRSGIRVKLIGVPYDDLLA